MYKNRIIADSDCRANNHQVMAYRQLLPTYYLSVNSVGQYVLATMEDHWIYTKKSTLLKKLETEGVEAVLWWTANQGVHRIKPIEDIV